MSETNWADQLACPVCPARVGERCYTMSSGGPQALPPEYADQPHSSRKRSAKSKPSTESGRTR